MSSTTIRVSEATRQRLRDLAAETGAPMQAVIEQAIEAYRRERFFAAVDAAYEGIWSDPAAREDELEERRLFEGTLADDLAES